MLPVLGSGGGTLPLQRNHFMPVGHSWVGGDQGNCIKCARIVMMISVKSARVACHILMMMMMLTGEGDPINARKLAVGFVQSLGGISFLKLFRISFLPQERDAPVDLYSSPEKESQDHGSPHH